MSTYSHNKVFDATKILLPSKVHANVNRSIQLERSPPDQAGPLSDLEPHSFTFMKEDTVDRSVDHNFVRTQKKKPRKAAGTRDNRREKQSTLIDTNTDLGNFLTKTSALPLQY